MELTNNEFMRIPGLLLITILFFSACSNSSHDYSPKPRGYYRIMFPEKQYVQYDGPYPFTFLYPAYAKIVSDSNTAPDGKKKLINMKYLLNMQFPQFNGTLHLSYESITSRKVFDELIEDAHSFAFKHTVKSTGINQALIYYPDRKLFGIYYTINGNAASSAQFFLTDSTKNYIRGAPIFQLRAQARLHPTRPRLRHKRT